MANSPVIIKSLSKGFTFSQKRFLLTVLLRLRWLCLLLYPYNGRSRPLIKCGRSCSAFCCFQGSHGLHRLRAAWDPPLLVC